MLLIIGAGRKDELELGVERHLCYRYAQAGQIQTPVAFPSRRLLCVVSRAESRFHFGFLFPSSDRTRSRVDIWYEPWRQRFVWSSSCVLYVKGLGTYMLREAHLIHTIIHTNATRGAKIGRPSAPVYTLGKEKNKRLLFWGPRDQGAAGAARRQYPCEKMSLFETYLRPSS